MAKIATAFKSILAKDSKHTSKEDESKDMLIMLRLEYMILSLYSLVLTIVVDIAVPGYAFIIPLIGVIYLVSGLLATYEFNIHVVSNLLLFGILGFSLLQEFFFGYSAGFQILILLGIPLIFSSIRINLNDKIIRSVLVGVLMIVSTIISPLVHPAVPISGIAARALQATSMLAISCSLGVISFSFCTKFIQAEHQLYQYNRQLKKMASLDPLTNLMNRRGMADVLPDLITDYHKGSNGLSVALADIDFFKKINDTYGHDCGDYILKTLASTFSKYMEGHGEICRWGGEEFLFAFTEQNTDNVFVFLNDLCNDIRHTVFSFGGEDIRLTVTFGLEEFDPMSTIEETIKKADEKLYLGKESGRDKVVY